MTYGEIKVGEKFRLPTDDILAACKFIKIAETETINTKVTTKAVDLETGCTICFPNNEVVVRL